MEVKLKHLVSALVLVGMIAGGVEWRIRVHEEHPHAQAVTVESYAKDREFMLKMVEKLQSTSDNLNTAVTELSTTVKMMREK